MKNRLWLLDDEVCVTVSSVSVVRTFTLELFDAPASRLGVNTAGLESIQEMGN